MGRKELEEKKKLVEEADRKNEELKKRYGKGWKEIKKTDGEVEVGV